MHAQLLLLASAVSLMTFGCRRREDPTPLASASASADRAPSCAARCKMGGLCAWDKERERCVATSDADCAKSDSCKTSGLCVQDKTVCIGTTAEHCKSSERCARDGLCTFTSRGLFPCEAKTNDDCSASEMCRRKGRCTALGGKCLVASAADCQRSEACRVNGQCSAKPTWAGDVTVHVCAALTNEDCAEGEDCKERNLCTAANDACR